MFEFNVIHLIPQALAEKAVDATVNFVVNLGANYLSDEMSRKIGLLRSDGAFRGAFEEGLQRAANRFAAEYMEQDEDLVAAIANDEYFFENREVQEALLTILQQPGVYLADEQETLLLSFDSVLPERHNRKRVKRAVTAFLKCLAKEVWHLPELRPAYEAQFQRMSANALHEMVTIQKQHLQATVGVGSDIRAALLQLTDAIAQQKLLPASQTLALPAPPKVYHNLPRPDYERFVGRKAELRQIRHLLLPTTRHFVITIDGIGGIGKSALALEVAENYRRYFDKLPKAERFDAIIWTTAKQTVLTGQGIIARTQSLRALDDIYSTIAITLEREEITRARTEEQDDIVRRALSQQRTLLIIDNLETVDDERIITFIRELPDPTKVIITTRHRLDVAYPIRLTGMSEAEALQLIADEARKKAVRLTKPDARHLYRRTGGVPLAIVWSVAQMAFGHNVPAVLKRLGQPNSDIAKFCFEGAVELIRNKPAHNLLMALSLFATDASRDALGYVADLPELDRDEGLVELEKLSLVNRKGGRFRLLPLTQAYSEGELAKQGELEKVFRERWVEFFFNFMLEQSPNWYESVDNVRIEVQNIVHVMDYCWQINDLKKFMFFVKTSSFYLWVDEKFSIRGKYIELALNAAESSALDLAKAHFLRLLSNTKQFYGDFDEARVYIQKAIDVYQLHDDNNELAKSFWQLASIEVQLKNYQTAQKNLQKAWAVAAPLNSKWHTSRIQRELARIDIAKGDYERAEIRLHKARELREESGQLSKGLAYIYLLLGRVSLFKQNYQIASQYFQKSMEIAKKIASQHDIAEVKLGMAQLELALGHSEKAKQLAHEALGVFTKLGMKREIRETQALLDQIAAQSG